MTEHRDHIKIEDEIIENAVIYYRSFADGGISSTTIARIKTNIEGSALDAIKDINGYYHPDQLSTTQVRYVNAAYDRLKTALESVCLTEVD